MSPSALACKAYLAPVLAPFAIQFPKMHFNGWVDDIGFGREGADPIQLAISAAQAYRELHEKLCTLDLKVGPKKTAFITTDKHASRALTDRLGPEEPSAATVLRDHRDLGIDHQAARRRRIPIRKQRLNKAKHRGIKLP